MAFGLNQLGNTTPKHITNYIAVLSAICSGIIAWLQTVDFISEHSIKVITGICSLVIVLAQAVRPFFGDDNPANTPYFEPTKEEK